MSFGIIILGLIISCVWTGKLAPLGGILLPSLMWYSQSRTLYKVKDNGIVEIKPGWGCGKRICVDGILNVSYNPHAMGMQKVKIEYVQGFVMINPDKPLEFVEALRRIYPDLSVQGFEMINN